MFAGEGSSFWRDGLGQVRADEAECADVRIGLKKEQA